MHCGNCDTEITLSRRMRL